MMRRLLVKKNPLYHRYAFSFPPRQWFVQQKRFRGKINIQKPRPPHFERARILEFVKPWYKSKLKDLPAAVTCGKVLTKAKVSAQKVSNPFQQIIAREALNWFESSKMIAFYHMNPTNSEDKFKFAVTLKEHNMHFKNYGRETIKMALANSPYKVVTTLFHSHAMIVFSPEQNVGKLLKITRKRPELILLAGIVDGKLLSHNEFVNYSKLGDITAVRASLVHVLRMAGGAHLNRQLMQPQSTLVSRLDHISKTEEQANENKE